MKKESVKDMTFVALCVAIMAVLSQLSIPVGTVPITLQTLIVPFVGYFLGIKKGISAIAVYILLGAVGVPVFSGFMGGLHVLLGYTGGFLFGFIPFAALCGINCNAWAKIALGTFGLILCHTIGVLQYAFLSGVGIGASFIAVSLPYLLKDIIFVIIAYFIAESVKKRLKI